MVKPEGGIRDRWEEEAINSGVMRIIAIWKEQMNGKKGERWFGCRRRRRRNGSHFANAKSRYLLFLSEVVKPSSYGRISTIHHFLLWFSTKFSKTVISFLNAIHSLAKIYTNKGFIWVRTERLKTKAPAVHCTGQW